jgi:hypothetical protein
MKARSQATTEVAPTPPFIFATTLRIFCLMAVRSIASRSDIVSGSVVFRLYSVPTVKNTRYERLTAIAHQCQPLLLMWVFMWEQKAKTPRKGRRY